MTLNDPERPFFVKVCLGIGIHRFACAGFQTKLFGNWQRQKCRPELFGISFMRLFFPRHWIKRIHWNSEILTGSPERWHQTRVGWGKQSIFYIYASISRKRHEIRRTLLLITNRKLHMGFRLAPRSMTLDDLELDGGRPPLFSNT